MTLRASELYLGHFRCAPPRTLSMRAALGLTRALVLALRSNTQPTLLAAARPGGPLLVGNCYVHPSAKVHATAKLGPNVSVAPGARVGPGVRLMNCILLDDVEVRDNAVVQNAIVGWKSSLGAWARVQGSGEYDAKMGICILGEDVKVADEVVVVNCIVLPHKEIKVSVKEEVIL